MEWTGVTGKPALPRSAIVVGAGVVGVATAWALARRGVAVTMIERANGPGQGASFANGAQLSYSYTDALANPALLRRIPALVLGLDPCFSISPRLDPGMIGWLLAFLRNATTSAFLANTEAGLALGLESRLALHDLLARHPIDFGHRMAGKIVVYRDQMAFSAACRLVDLKRQHGGIQDILDPTAAIGIEPALASQADQMVGAIHSPQEELGDPHRFCQAMIEMLTESYGVSAKFGAAVQCWQETAESVVVTATSGESLVADQLVVCAGIEAGQVLGRTVGSSALMPMKGYSLTAPPGSAAPRMSITDVYRKIVFCPLDGAVRVAGLAELGARHTRVEPTRIARLKAIAAQSLPDAADYAAARQEWAGIRPMTADSQPIIRRVTSRVAINAGHGMLGWTYAMGAAERMARLLGE
jgi:D-amino-acid dehydrogenase